MIYASKAYYYIRDDLYKLLDTGNGLSESNIAMTKDLIFLFEFAIPVVLI